MLIKGRYSDRRYNENERRHHACKCNSRRCNSRRRKVRLNVPFEISLPDRDCKTINVSASGVYFEVAIKDMEAFSLGTTIPLQIKSVTNTPGSLEQKLKLGGRGTVIRHCIIENPRHENTLGVVLEYTEKLNTVVDSY